MINEDIFFIIVSHGTGFFFGIVLDFWVRRYIFYKGVCEQVEFGIDSFVVDMWLLVL